MTQTQTQTAVSTLSLRREDPPSPYEHADRPQGEQCAPTSPKICESCGDLASAAPRSCWRCHQRSTSSVKMAKENPQPEGQRRKTTMNAGTRKTYKFLPIGMRHPPGNMRTDRLRRSPASKPQQRKTTTHAGPIKSYKFLPIAMHA